jgi:hypothetical protein
VQERAQRRCPWRTFSSCSVSSAMRPLLGRASRRVSRSSSFAGLGTASQAGQARSDQRGAAAAAAAQAARCPGGGSGDAIARSQPTCSSRTVVQAACHLQHRLPTRHRLPPNCCSAAGIAAAQKAAACPARQPGCAGQRRSTRLAGLHLVSASAASSVFATTLD